MLRCLTRPTTPRWATAAGFSARLGRLRRHIRRPAPPALTRLIATSCGCKKAEASTHRAIACAAYAALHPDEPVNNAPANIAGSKRTMVTWRAKLRPALLLIMRERRAAALGSAAQLRAEKPEERGDGKEASALGTSASFIRCMPCTNQAGHRWLVICRYEPPRCGAVECGQIGCDVTIRCDCADPPEQESPGVAAPDGTRSTLEFDSTLGFPGEGWSSGISTASSSSRVLILCSGPYAREDSLGAFLHQCGFEVWLMDNDPVHGDPAHDILSDSFFQHLLHLVSTGHFFAVFAAPPCSTFSVSRHYRVKRKRSQRDSGPPPVRLRHCPTGIIPPPPGHSAELATANSIVDRICTILTAASTAGAEFIIENPADRSNASISHTFLCADHCPLWLYPDVATLKQHAQCRTCTFAQCEWGAEYQKYTTLLYTPGLAPFLDACPLALALAKTDVWEGHAGQTQATSSRMQNP